MRCFRKVTPSVERFARFKTMSDVNHILSRAVQGERISCEEALCLFESDDLIAIGQAAKAITDRRHPERYRTYNIDRNINYTNVCAATCHFCAFYRRSNDPQCSDGKNSRDS